MEKLSDISGRAVATLLRQQPEKMKWIVSFLPFTIQLWILIHFNNNQFEAYLKCYPRIGQIEKKANDQEFQLFLINFLTRREDDTYFCSYERDLQFELLHRWCFLNENLNQFVTSAHFPSQALGLGELIFKCWGDASYEYYMFVRKFNQKIYSITYPLTYLPKTLFSFMGDKTEMHLLVQPYFMLPSKIPNIKRKERKCFPSEKFLSVKEKFCLRMVHLFSLFHTERYHECVFKCVELLEEYRLENIHYKMYCWACLAVSLSVFDCLDLTIRSCLNQVKTNVLFKSDEFDYLLTKQHIYHVRNNVKKEKKMFTLIFNRLPKKSRFCSNSFKLHIKMQLQNMENLFCEIICFKRKLIVNRRKQKEDIEWRQNLIQKDAKRLKKLIYKILSLGELENYKKFENYLHIVNLYLSISKDCENDFVFDDHLTELRALENIKHSFHFMAKLLNYDNDYTLHGYTENMNLLQENIANLTHDRHSKKYADVCFTHFVFLAMTHPNYLILDHFRSYALAFYEKTNHYRATLLRDFQTAESLNHVSFEVTPYFRPLDSQFCKLVSVPKLFAMENKLKYIVFAGRKSLKLYNNYSLS